MNQTKSARTLPKTRIAVFFLWVNRFSFAVVLLAGLSGFVVGRFDLTVPLHIPMGLGAVFLGMFGLVAAMFYLITTGAAVKEAVISNNLPKELYARTAQLKKNLFPWCGATIVLLIMLAVVGGAIHVGIVPPYVHTLATLLVLAVYYKTNSRMKLDFQENREIMADALELMDRAV